MNEIYLTENRNGGNMAVKENGDIQDDGSLQSLVYLSLYGGYSPLNVITGSTQNNEFEESLNNKISVANMLESERLGDDQLKWLVETGIVQSAKTIISNIGLERVEVKVEILVGDEKQYITFDEFKEGRKDLFIPKDMAQYMAVLGGTNNMLILSTVFETADNHDWYMEIDCELTNPNLYALVYPFRNSGGGGLDLSKLGLYLDYLSYSSSSYNSIGGNYKITNPFPSPVRDTRIVLRWQRYLPPLAPVVKLFLNNVEVGGISYSGSINIDSIMSYVKGNFYSCHMKNNTTGQEINIETTKAGFIDTISGNEYPALSGTTIEEIN